MGVVEETAGKVADSLIAEGPTGILAVVGWLCTIVLATGFLMVLRELKAERAARMKDKDDALALAQKEIADQDRKMDILQASLFEARR